MPVADPSKFLVISGERICSKFAQAGNHFGLNARRKALQIALSAFV